MTTTHTTINGQTLTLIAVSTCGRNQISRYSVVRDGQRIGYVTSHVTSHYTTRAWSYEVNILVARRLDRTAKRADHGYTARKDALGALLAVVAPAIGQAS